MTFTFRPAKRENVPLLIGVAGGTGSGKTYSALLLARGLANGQPFAGLDTENGRMLHYADLFPEMQHGKIGAPFRPSKYADAIEAADEQGYPVIVVDSMSHEWAGDGGCLDWHDELMAGDQRKNLSAWIEPKKQHKRMVTRLLQVNAHVILAFRAEPKVEAIRENGQTKIVPKASLIGLDGWLPISEKMLPYELTASFLLMADRPGVPRPIKLQEQHRPLVPLDEPLSEQVGRRLAEWAKGGQAGPLPEGGANEGGGEASDGHIGAGDANREASVTPSGSDFRPPDGALDQPLELTASQLDVALREAKIPAATTKAKGSELFPGKSKNALTDLERGQLWKALNETQEALPV